MGLIRVWNDMNKQSGHGSWSLLFRLLALCGYLKQAHGPNVQAVMREIQSWTHNFSADYFEGLAKIEMIHDKTFQDILDGNDGTGVAYKQFQTRTNKLFWTVIFTAFDDYKQYLSHPIAPDNYPWLTATLEMHYKLDELQSLHPDMCKYTMMHPWAAAYKKREVRTHHFS
jgi:hypothetical protein